jgi:hypothetical protein
MYTSISKRPTTIIADRIVGYSVLTVTDSVRVLGEGKNDDGNAQDIPPSATGAILVGRLMEGGEMLYRLDGGEPSTARKRGVTLVEKEINGNFTLYLGLTSESSGDREELENFKAMCSTGKRATINITYINYGGL